MPTTFSIELFIELFTCDSNSDNLLSISNFVYTSAALAFVKIASEISPNVAGLLLRASAISFNVSNVSGAPPTTSEIFSLTYSFDAYDSRMPISNVPATPCGP